MDNIEYAKNFSEMLSKARYESGKSLEYMAHSLGISKQTCINYEKGTSYPNLKLAMQWFEVLGINFHRPLMELMYPDLYKNISADDTDDKIGSAIVDFISTLPTKAQRQIAYLFLGEHGSDPSSLLQLFTAYLHLPLQNRVSIASAIYEAYEMCDQLGVLVCPEHIKIDKNTLKSAITSGKKAVVNNQSGYTNNVSTQTDCENE